jgi:hypothetical protein
MDLSTRSQQEYKVMSRNQYILLQIRCAKNQSLVASAADTDWPKLRGSLKLRVIAPPNNTFK